MSLGSKVDTGYLTVVKHAREAAQNPAAFSNKELEEIARTFADLCAEARKRLADCISLLRAGYRSEAIRQAEFSPRLIELASALSFPEAMKWQTICEQLNLPSPSLIASEDLAELAAAYDRSVAVSAFLTRLRQLCIANAPLHKRINVLRKLVAVEPDNLPWQEDLVKWESILLEQMAKEAAKAYALNDSDALMKISLTLQGSEWKSPDIVEVIVRVQKYLNELLEKKLRQELQSLASEIQQAHSAGDEPRLVALREQFQIRAEKLRLDPADPFATAVRPAFAWLAEKEQLRALETKRRQLVARLEKLLKQPTSLGEIKGAYARALKSGAELSPELLVRYRQVTDQLKAARRKRIGLLLLAAVCILVLFVTASILGGIIKG